MRNRGLIATIVVLIAVIITLVAVVFLMQMPTIFSVSNIKSSIDIKQTETTSIKIEETTQEEVETTKALPKLSTKVETYTNSNKHVNINYPQISGMDDAEMQKKLNNKIKVNATSIVSLYPISTAIQYLDIDCEVKSFDDKHITILYKGEVVGKSIKNPSSNKSSSSGNVSVPKTNTPNAALDPYLDGFVDPLAGLNQYAIPFQSNIVYDTVVPPENTNVNNSNNTEVFNNGQNKVVGPNKNNTNTEDKGPTPVDIIAPTSPKGVQSQQAVTDNYSYNNPGGSVQGFTGTNVRNDASTIDQKIFYTNTIDLRTGLDLRLSDYVSDLNDLAKYIRSSDVEFENIESSSRKEVRDYINKTVQSKLAENLKEADFKNEGVKSWPKVFSYKGTDGIVYISVRLSSKLGNYAIVKYKK